MSGPTLDAVMGRRTRIARKAAVSQGDAVERGRIVPAGLKHVCVVDSSGKIVREKRHIMLTRATRFSALKRWAMEVAKRRGMFTDPSGFDGSWR